MEMAMAQLIQANAALTSNNIQLTKQVQTLYARLEEQTNKLNQLNHLLIIQQGNKQLSSVGSIPPGHVVMPNLFQQATQGQNPLFASQFSKPQQVFQQQHN